MEKFEAWRTSNITPAMIDEKINQVNAQKRLLLGKFKQCMGKNKTISPHCGGITNKQVRILQQMFPHVNIKPYLYPNRGRNSPYYHMGYVPQVLKGGSGYHSTRPTSFKGVYA